MRYQHRCTIQNFGILATDVPFVEKMRSCVRFQQTRNNTFSEGCLVPLYSWFNDARLALAPFEF